MDQNRKEQHDQHLQGKKKNRNRLLFLAGLLVLILILGSLYVITYKPTNQPHINLGTSVTAYYVSPAGSDFNDGSSSRPWATIQKAADKATPGTTIYVEPGTYQQNIISKANGTATARITFTAATKWGARIRSRGVQITWENLGNYVNIVGFDISGDGSYGILNRASYVQTIGNLVHDIPASACDSDGGAGIDNGSYQGKYSGHDNNIIGNIVHDIGPKTYCNLVHGIYQANFRANIWNNISYRNSAMGIQTWHAASDLNIANNLVFENGRGGIIIAAGGSPWTSIADNCVVVNNIVIHNATYGIYEYAQTGIHNRYLNNLVYANPTNLLLQHGNKAQGTIVADPRFVNYQPDGSGDYHLAAGSPAIGTGTSTGEPTSDMDGFSRTIVTAVDLGPYAYRSGGVRTGRHILKKLH